MDTNNSSMVAAFNGLDVKPVPAPKINLNGSYSSSSGSSTSKHHHQQQIPSSTTINTPSNTTTSVAMTSMNNAAAASALYASLQRPRCPPPPLPPHQTKTTPLRTNSNGRQEDSIPFTSIEGDDCQLRSSIPLPVPPPRRVSFLFLWEEDTCLS